MTNEEGSPSASPDAIPPGKGVAKQKRPKPPESQFRLSRKANQAIQRHLSAVVESAAKKMAMDSQPETLSPKRSSHPNNTLIKTALYLISDLWLEHKIKMVVLSLVTIFANLAGKISLTSVLTIFGSILGFALVYAFNKIGGQ